MDRKMGRVWAIRVGAGLVFLGLVFAGLVTWRYVDIVESEFLRAVHQEAPRVEILEVAPGRVALADGEAAARSGVWGIATADAYGQIGDITFRGDGRVERVLTMIYGAFGVGDVAVVDRDAFPSDPRTALGMPYEEIRVPGDLGVNPAWLISGEGDTWVVFVHGRSEGRAQALRSLATFRKLGFPVLVITYRNDLDGGVDEGSPLGWGLDEWRDLEVALDTARLRGANDFVLVGHGMGGGIVMTWLNESPSIGDVRGVVVDSPILDLEALVDRETESRGFPGFIGAVGKWISRIRFGLEWSKLDQVARAGEFDPSIPILLLQGTADGTAPVGDADAFAAGAPNVTYDRFEGATHGALWNVDPARYEATLSDFLTAVKPGLELDS